MNARTALTATFALAAAALIAAPVAGATTYNNDTPIIIPGTPGTANPYPSSITVSGTAGPITDVNVGFDGFTHGVPAEVGIVLVSPTGQALALLDCVGGFMPASGVFITLDDAAAGNLPANGALSTGTFKPTSNCASAKSFPSPGPLTTYENPGPARGGNATFASTFNGLSAIGTWNLYVFDPFDGNSGSIPGGWSLDVKPDVTPLPAAMPPVVTPTPTPTPTPAKKCKKKAKKGASAAKGCKKKRKK